MKDYKTIFFWLGGVLIDSLPRLTFATLLPEKERRIEVPTWQAFRYFAEELALGKITATEYCTRSIDEVGSSIDPSTMEKRLLEAMCLREEVIAIIRDLPSKYDCRLISDLPLDWYKQISTKVGSEFPVPDDQIVFTSALNIKRMVPDIFHALPASVNCTMTECIVVDAVSARAVEAVKSGFASIIYVYPNHLKHEFALQQILIAENEVLHPQSSERARI
jgi:FMN phosphatase YigB (HAD superfamily)